MDTLVAYYANLMCALHVYSTYNSVYKLKIKTNNYLMQVTEYISLINKWQNRCTFLQLFSYDRNCKQNFTVYSN